MGVYFMPTWLDYSAKGLGKYLLDIFMRVFLGDEFMFKSIEST